MPQTMIVNEPVFPRSDPAPKRELSHIPALDGLRGVAILFVMAFHFFQFEPMPSSHLGQLIFALMRFGQTGVDLFFVLSGFLITRILLSTRHCSGYFRTFYARRTLRIFPLYYGVLIVIFGILPFTRMGQQAWLRDAEPHQAWMWLYLTNIAVFLGIPVAATHFWTLAVEEQFYLVWPAVVLAMGRRGVMIASVVLIVAALITRIAMKRHGLDIWSFTPCRMDALAIGALLAALEAAPAGLPWLRPAAILTAIVCAIALAPTFVLKGSSHDWLIQSVKYSLVAFLYAAVLILVAIAPPLSPLGRAMKQPVLRTIGKYSYAMYVFHGMLAPWFDEHFSGAGLRGPLHSYAAALLVKSIAVGGVTFLAAWLSWHLYEKRFLRLKRFFEYREEDRGVLRA